MANLTKKVVNAFEFAYEVHKGTKRKGKNVPYIVHPMDVASILIKNSASEDLVVAGLLHDVIEEENVKLIKISELFGETVANLVNAVTEPEELRKSSIGKKQTWK